MISKFIKSLLIVSFMGAVCLASPDYFALGPYGGDVRSLAVHPDEPNRILLGTADGQLFVSENAGEKWAKLSPGLQRRDLVLDSIVFHPQNPRFILVAGWELKSDKGALYKSVDGGSTWDRIDLGFFESSIRAVAISPANPQHIAVGITEGVLLSKDGGRSWDRISRGYRSLHYVHSLAFDPVNPDLLYVGTWRLAWKTENLGKSWVPIHSGMNFDSDLFSLQVDQENPQVVMAGACSGIYRSVNKGESWKKLRNGLPSEAKRTRVVRIDPTRPSTLYSGTTVGLFRSLDAGESWKRLLSDVVINDIIVDSSDPSHLILGTDDAGVLHSYDSGQSFKPANSGFSQRQVSAVAVRGHEYYAAVTLDGQYGGLLRSTDDGNTWKTSNKGLGEAVGAITSIRTAEKSREVWLGTSYGVFVGIPGSSDWSRFPGTSGLVVNELDFSNGDERAVLVAAEQGIFLIEPDRNRLSKLKIPVYDRQVFSVFVDKESSQIFLGTEMGVFLSTDEGKTWTIRVEGLPYTSVTTIRRVGKRLFCGTKSGLFFSDNNGENWIKAEGVFPIEITAVEQATKDAAQVYASDSLVGYLFVSSDNGKSFVPMDLGLGVSRISSLCFTGSGELLAGTLTEGVVRLIPKLASGSSTDASGSSR